MIVGVCVGVKPCLPEVFLRLRTLSELPSLRVLERVSMVEALLMVV